MRRTPFSEEHRYGNVQAESSGTQECEKGCARREAKEDDLQIAEEDPHCAREAGREDGEAEAGAVSVVNL